MGRKVSNNDIIEIQKAFVECGSYAAAARRTGWSVSTVKRYASAPIVEAKTREPRRFDKQLLREFDSKPLADAANLGDLCVLTEQERTEIEELWEEIQI